jgi:hypothetical protein
MDFVSRHHPKPKHKSSKILTIGDLRDCLYLGKFLPPKFL